jgi:Zn-dependent peptidase ImmA (M78 family)
LSYSYKKRSAAELEELAGLIIGRFANRLSGCVVDVEGIAEDCGITILPRRGGLRKYVLGYVPADPHYIVVAEQAASYAPGYRPVISEELCHIILEYDLLNGGGGTVPLEAQPHNLTPQQHSDIEGDARYLALAVLFPRQLFITHFNKYSREAPRDVAADRGELLRYCARSLETDFQVWDLQVAYRARDLGLISPEECRNHFSNRLPL